MANYVFYDGSVVGSPKFPEATPGDTSTVILRRQFVDCALQTLTAGSDEGHVIPVNAGEMVLGVSIRVKTAETANGNADVGIDGGNEFAANALLTSTANTVLNHWNAVYIAADGNITVYPNNSVNLDGAAFEIIAMVTKAFDKF